MKKIILLTVILLVVITFSGCNDKKSSEQTENIAEEIASQKSIETNSQENGGILNSIKDAISSNKKMECIYVSSEDGLNAEIKTYIQGDKYKTEFLMDGKKNNSIFDGKISYSWEEGSKQGVKIDMECFDSLDDGVDINNFKEVEDVEVVQESDNEPMDIFDGAQDVNCQNTGDIDFSIPQDINFIDQCEMLKNQQQLINNFSDQIPEGLPEF
jgi:hypothetical protein